MARGPGSSFLGNTLFFWVLLGELLEQGGTGHGVAAMKVNETNEVLEEEGTPSLFLQSPKSVTDVRKKVGGEMS